LLRDRITSRCLDDDRSDTDYRGIFLPPAELQWSLYGVPEAELSTWETRRCEQSMTTETPFRLSMIALFVLSLATTGYHRIQAAKSGEKVSRKDEGLLLFLAIRLGAVPMLLSTVGYVINPRWLQWASLPLPDGVRWIGAGLGLFTVLLLYWTLRTLGKNLTDTVMIRAKHTLVTTGPYRFVRHPFYVSLILLVSASALMAANWFIGLSGLLVFSLLGVRCSIEERKLIERFGDDYRSYMDRTWRFVPRLW
jgi:protein-S-isoprenylcysteine O-methyltransferase Ste14